MYKAVGKEIKGWAKVIVVLLTISSVLIGIVIWLAFMDQEAGVLGFALGVVVALIGYILARLSAIKLYGYGELIDRVCSIDMKLGPATAEEIVADADTSSFATDTMPWACPICGRQNYYADQKCGKCYTQKPGK